MLHFHSLSLPDAGALPKNWSQLLVLLVFENDLAPALDHMFASEVAKRIRSIALMEHFRGQAQQCCQLVDVPGCHWQRLWLVGLGERANVSSVKSVLSQLASKLIDNACTHAALSFPATIAQEMYLTDLCQALFDASYQNHGAKTTKPSATKLKRIGIVKGEHTNVKAFRQIVAYQRALHLGKTLTKDLANAPCNLCTPEYLADTAKDMAADYDAISVDILDEARMAELGMGAFLAVSRGSERPGFMPVLHYQHKDAVNASPVVLIGKGITFDTGGISLKSAPGMNNMIYDMAGAACVLGVMKAVAELNLPVNLIVMVAAAENMPDGNAYRPGDIVTTLSGQTVEIISTDAEGRLVLCDAMTYATRFSPMVMIDVATLTGAAIVSLGHVASGLMSNNQLLADALLQAGESANDKAWQMPLWDDFQDALDSPFADMKNSGSNSPGMITAGCFLKRFAGDIPWAHLDVAGTSFRYGIGNSATARPLGLLLAYLCDLSSTGR